MSELISQSNRSLIFKDINAENGETLIWKTTGSGSNSVSELANEYEITRHLGIKGIRKAFGKGPQRTSPKTVPKTDAKNARKLLCAT